MLSLHILNRQKNPVESKSNYYNSLQVHLISFNWPIDDIIIINNLNVEVGNFSGCLLGCLKWEGINALLRSIYHSLSGESTLCPNYDLYNIWFVVDQQQNMNILSVFENRYLLWLNWHLNCIAGIFDKGYFHCVSSSLFLMNWHERWIFNAPNNNWHVGHGSIMKYIKLNSKPKGYSFT